MDAAKLLQALRQGPATLDALAARLGSPPRDELRWAIEEAAEHGWVTSSESDCGPDGVCSTTGPAILSLTEAGREAAASA